MPSPCCSAHLRSVRTWAAPGPGGTRWLLPHVLPGKGTEFSWFHLPLTEDAQATPPLHGIACASSPVPRLGRGGQKVGLFTASEGTGHRGMEKQHPEPGQLHRPHCRHPTTSATGTASSETGRFPVVSALLPSATLYCKQRAPLNKARGCPVSGRGREAGCLAAPERTLPGRPSQDGASPSPRPTSSAGSKAARRLPWMTSDGHVLNGSWLHYMQRERVKQDGLNSL